MREGRLAGPNAREDGLPASPDESNPSYDELRWNTVVVHQEFMDSLRLSMNNINVYACVDVNACTEILFFLVRVVHT